MIANDGYIPGVKSNRSSHLRLSSVNFAYRSARPLFTRLNVSLDRGNGLVISGGRGSGKTTFIKLVMGLLLPEAGDILVDGQSVVDMSMAERIQLYSRWGLILDDPVIPPDRTLRYAIWTAMKLSSGRSAGQSINRVAASVLSQFGMAHKLQLTLDQLPDDEAHIVQLAVATARNPEMIIWDDPDEHLDSDGLHSAIDIVRKAQLSGSSVLLTTSCPEMYSQLGWAVVDIGEHAT